MDNTGIIIKEDCERKHNIILLGLMGSTLVALIYTFIHTSPRQLSLNMNQLHQHQY